MVRGGFSIVELIFSIVIIGIAAATMPLIVSSANSLESDIQNQDIYFKNQAIITDVISKFWDKTLSDSNTTPSIISVSSRGDTALATNRTTSRYENFLLQASTLNKNIAPITKESTGLTSIDDYNGRYIDESAADSNVRSDITVVYVLDTTKKRDNNRSMEYCDWNLTGETFFTSDKDSTNLKRITVATKRKSGDTVFESFLTYFASNIGSINR